MAERRMFAKTVIDSDAFLDMSLTTQALYFHLAMRADDDGFINNANKIMRMINAAKNDYDVLLSKKFILEFDEGIIVIKHWRMHNYIRKDRYNETAYTKQLEMLEINENNSYSIKSDNTTIIDYEPIDACQPSGIPTVDTGKVRLGKVSLDNIMYIFEYYQDKGIIKHRSLSQTMEKALTKFFKTYTKEDAELIIDRHFKVVELTKASKYPVKPRALNTLFAQKITNDAGSPYIYEEYLEGGAKYESYIKGTETSVPVADNEEISAPRRRSDF